MYKHMYLTHILYNTGGTDVLRDIHKYIYIHITYVFRGMYKYVYIHIYIYIYISYNTGGTDVLRDIHKLGGTRQRHFVRGPE